MAEIMKLAICRVLKALPKDCRLILAAGNLVLFEVPEGQLKEVSALICKTMEQRPPSFSVKLSVEIRSGKTWAECNPNPYLVPDRRRRRSPGPRTPRIAYRIVD
jgi:DNA polymerase I-like protein with 3'-5' exonuclease and polymerase domains